jgi:hypothetical protein
MERAVATFSVDVTCGDCYARWEILDDSGNVVREHPRMSKANFDAKKPAARLSTGRQGWLWDGRNGDPKPVLVASGSYKSRLTVKDTNGTQVVESVATIRAEGSPYRIFLVGTLQLPTFGGRLLDASGRRISRDCWTLVYRGVEDDGHAVFLGQGTIEAQKTDAGSKAGAIATPHGREFKGWVRSNPHGDAGNADRIQVEDLYRTDAKIELTNPGGPSPLNPYADADRGPYKDGVQAHQGNPVWVGDATSVGCTTGSNISGHTVTDPGSTYGPLRSIDSSFGDWGDNPTSEDISVGGPTFVNKQFKRSHAPDALIADDHASPMLDTPPHPRLAASPLLVDEPLHMQRTLQQAAFGGFRGHEIPREGSVADEPTSILRIRMVLGQYAPNSLYHLYHHAVVFGHMASRRDNSFEITAWFPRHVIRGWNGNFRNVLVKGRCEISWYIEHVPRHLVLASVAIPALHPLDGAAGTMADLPDSLIGRARKTWTLPSPPLPALPDGDYNSVIKYRLELNPYTAGGDDWIPEPAVKDRFAPAGSSEAELDDEVLVPAASGGKMFVEGCSRLRLMSVP